MPFPPGNELEAWLLDWLDDIAAGAHPECESAVDLLVAFFEDLGLFLDEQEATNDDYQRIIAVCLDRLLAGDCWTPEDKRSGLA